MVKIDYISTKDINRVAKIHSNKKYFNWIMKVIENEYRFYPPIVIEQDEDYLDDFDFSQEDDTFEFEDAVQKQENEKVPMFGEIWDNTTRFFTEDKFNFTNLLESKLDKKMHTIKKGMNSLAKIEQFTDTKVKISWNQSRAIKKERFITFSSNNDSYKLYRVKQNSNCLAKIKKYENEYIKENKPSKNMAFSAKIKKFLENKQDEIEILSLDEEFI